MTGKYFLSKDYGTEFVSNLDFMSRPGIYWKWKSSIFNGKVFGSNLDSTNCFLAAGVHDFGHCIDFLLRGKTRSITSHGLDFKRKYRKFIPGLNIYDGYPKSAQATLTETRAFALEAYLQNREVGMIMRQLDSDDEDTLRSQGKLDHLPPAPDRSQSLWPRLEYRLLEKCSIEEFAASQRSLVSYPWDDSTHFLASRGYPDSYKTHTLKERDLLWQDCFEQAIIEEYERLQGPLMEAKISSAIDVLAERIRRYQRQEGFVPDESHIGVRPKSLRLQAA